VGRICNFLLHLVGVKRHGGVCERRFRVALGGVMHE